MIWGMCHIMWEAHIVEIYSIFTQKCEYCSLAPYRTVSLQYHPSYHNLILKCPYHFCNHNQFRSQIAAGGVVAKHFEEEKDEVYDVGTLHLIPKFYAKSEAHGDDKGDHD